MKKREDGFIFIQVFIGLILLGVVGVVFQRWIDRSAQIKHYLDVRNTADNIRMTVLNTLEHDLSWQQTIQSSSQFDCLKVPGANCAGQGGAFDLRRADGVPVVISTNPTNGFTALGDPCSTYSPTGNNDCPFRVTLSWSPDCPSGGGPCLSIMPSGALFAASPRVRIEFDIRFSPANPERFIYFNHERYEFDSDYRRGDLHGVTASQCAALGHRFDASTGRCTFSFTVDCRPDRGYFVGIDPVTGEGLCRQSDFIDQRCPPRRGVVGVRPDGRWWCGKF